MVAQARSLRRRRIGLIAAGCGALVAAAALAPSLGLLGTDAFRLTPAATPGSRLAAVYLSGDMGLRFGMGARVVPALAARGIPVVGVSSPALFGRHRSRHDVDLIVADAIRETLRRTGADRVILMGQSYGADIVAAAAPDLIPPVRERIAAVVLVVPAQAVYFRADPLGFAYHGTPDATPASAMRGLSWTPVVCIHGVAEEDSLCPAIAGQGAEVIGLPGGHFLRHDDRRLIDTIMAALKRLHLGSAPAKPR